MFDSHFTWFTPYLIILVVSRWASGVGVTEDVKQTISLVDEVTGDLLYLSPLLQPHYSDSDVRRIRQDARLDTDRVRLHYVGRPMQLQDNENQKYRIYSISSYGMINKKTIVFIPLNASVFKTSNHSLSKNRVSNWIAVLAHQLRAKTLLKGPEPGDYTMYTVHLVKYLSSIQFEQYVVLITRFHCTLFIKS